VIFFFSLLHFLLDKFSSAIPFFSVLHFVLKKFGPVIPFYPAPVGSQGLSSVEPEMHFKVNIFFLKKRKLICRHHYLIIYSISSKVGFFLQANK
jgi:hypothetical protein